MDTAVVVTFVVATVSFVVVVVTVVVGIATVSGAAIVVFDSIRAVLGWVGGAVPKEDVESTILSHAVRISSELSALFHLKVPTIPMSTRLPAKKLETAVDEPVAVVVVVVDSAVALAAAVAAAETTILVVSTKEVGSRSNGSPNDRDVVHRAVVDAVVNATTADGPTQHPKNSTARHNATILYPAVTIVMMVVVIIAAAAAVVAVVVAVNVEKRGFG